MAHKKGQGSVRNGRDSNPQHRGLKVAGGTRVKKGVILIRQCGTRWKPGRNVGMGKDYTLYAETEGTVTFQANRKVHVDPVASGATATAAPASAPRT